MKQLTLKVENRESTGGGASYRLRKSGFVPAVIYGPSGSRNISVSNNHLRELLRAMRGIASVIEIDDDKGNKALSLLQEVQRDASTDKFIHADFLEVSQDSEMQATLPVHVVGESIGVKNEDANLEVLMHEISIRCLPKNLPNYIEVDVTALHAGEAVHIRDLKAIDGVTVLGAPDLVVVLCAAPQSKEEEVPVAEATESEGEAEKEEATDKAENKEAAES